MMFCTSHFGSRAIHIPQPFRLAFAIIMADTFICVYAGPQALPGLPVWRRRDGTRTVPRGRIVQLFLIEIAFSPSDVERQTLSMLTSGFGNTDMVDLTDFRQNKDLLSACALELQTLSKCSSEVSVNNVENFTDFSQTKGLPKPEVLSECSPVLQTLLERRQVSATPQTFSQSSSTAECQTRDKGSSKGSPQMLSEATPHCPSDIGTQTFQSLFDCMPFAARNVPFLLIWFLLRLLGFFALLHYSLQAQGKLRYEEWYIGQDAPSGRHGWLLATRAGIESRMQAREISFHETRRVDACLGCSFLTLDATVPSIGTASRTWVVPLDALTWRECLLKRFPELDLQTLSGIFWLQQQKTLRRFSFGRLVSEKAEAPFVEANPWACVYM